MRISDDSIRVIQSIPVSVYIGNGFYTASFSSISASGDTEEEAVDNLADIIVSKFHLFSQKESILGEHPRRQLRELRQYLQLVRHHDL